MNKQDLREMEWLWHVGLDLSKHVTTDDIAESARSAYRCLENLRAFEDGDWLVIAVVKGPRNEEHA